MQSQHYAPHIDVLLKSLRVSRERLNGKSRVAIDARVLKALIQTLVRSIPFSEEFYLASYPDVADAYDSGQITDLHNHYVQTGYFEGRSGSAPEVDENFYLSVYPDVQAAIKRGELKSASQHYVSAGAAEGRIPNEAMREDIEAWLGILRDDATAA